MRRVLSELQARLDFSSESGGSAALLCGMASPFRTADDKKRRNQGFGALPGRRSPSRTAGRQSR